MFDAIFNKTPEAAALGTFTVTNGNVTKGGNPLVTWFNDKSVIIAMNARVSFTLPAEHQMFDSILMDLMAKNIGVMYVESVTKFMDPKARFGEFLDGKLDPKSVGMDLPAPLNNLPELYQTVKGLFEAMFTAPVPPMSPGVDLTKFFLADQIVEIEKWRNNEISGLSQTVKDIISRHNQKNAGLLRVVANGNTFRIQNEQSHYISKTRFVDAYNGYIKAIWARDLSNHGLNERLNSNYQSVEAREGRRTYNDSHNLGIFKNHVEVGCQSIPRAEVEAMIQKLTAL